MAALNVTPKDVVYDFLANNFQSAAEQKVILLRALHSGEDRGLKRPIV
ncbi:hypothetical protein [Candidatus Coxiella mudrowiae]|nr:hypothetical protein [Candidatus Coxiella mudrowiae]